MDDAHRLRTVKHSANHSDDRDPSQLTSADIGPIALSVVVPVYSGEAYIQKLVSELEALRMQWSVQRAPLSLDEVVLVDDCAIDRSPDIIDQLADEIPWVVPLHLARNFGQHAATIAGILHSAGDWIVTLDEDLQHPPAQIPELLRKAVETRSDVIYANAEAGVHETAVRDVTSRSYKRLIERLTRNPNVGKFSSFRVIRGPVARAAASVCTHDTYFDVALSWFTERIDAVSMQLKDQRYISTGQTGYGFRALLSHARRLFVSSQLNVLRVGALFGVCVVGLSVVGGLVLLITKLVRPATIMVTGWTSLMLTIAFFGGMVIMLLGIVLEYMSILVLRAHGKPLFFTIDRTSDSVLVGHFSGDTE